MALTRYPLNPLYGSGAFRRRIRQRSGPGWSAAIVDDNHHAMWVRLAHDGSDITGVTSWMYRFPADTCPKAGAILEELCSLPVDIDPQALFAGGRARRNCTHLFDIAVLALTFIPKKEVERTFDFFIPDAHGPDRILRACVNGIVVHDWRVEDEIITAPASLSGIDMARGFIGQMTKVMSGVDLETALMLQKSLHVARGRLRISDQSPGRSLADAVDMLGACYTYSQPRFSVAVEVGGYIRDFSNGVEETPWPD